MFNRDQYINSPIEIENELLFLLKKDQVKSVFDIGACEAEDSIRYSLLFPNATIYAFEPRTDNIAIGKESIKKYERKNIVLENIALSNANGVAEFFLSEGRPQDAGNEEWDFGNKSSSLLPPSEEMKKHTSWLKFDKRIEVQTLRLQDYVSSKSISEIDFAHIDVQGAELMVLEGAGDFLNKIKLIWMEVEAVELYRNQPLKNDMEEFMKKNNFVNVLDTVNAVAGDQLYVNTSYFEPTSIKAFKKTFKTQTLKAKIRSFFKK
ncbi:FkbM family methyltransferase [Aurantibacillus circumpalustris]|uniref:FkbM family methyltransferase n=1 Tax=Aurantibacillus circumpalustris TaxID=3036359 RepID=UPI00295BF820|nr:FkbM family methyltransferase [Aurantibacillus circumpalustris]